MHRKISFVAAVALAVSIAVAPGAAASATSAYDAVTQSTLANLKTAMQYYSLINGSYNGVTAAALAPYGFTNGSSTHTEIYVLSGGSQFWAVAADTHSGSSQYAIRTTGNFLGATGGGVGLTNAQPAVLPTTAGVTFRTTANMPDLVALAGALGAAIPATKYCDAILVMPGTHAYGSSLTDQYIECVAAAGVAGATAATVLQTMLTHGWVGPINSIAAWFIGDGTSAPAVPAWADGINTTPPTTLPDQPATLPTYWNASKVAAAILAANPSLTSAQSQVAAKQCLVSMANTMQPTDPYKECTTKPIFVTGRDVAEATDHDIIAIAGNFSWLKLNYVSGTIRETEISRNWYSGYPECTPSQPGKSCDEYPFFSSAQSGPGASLKLILSDDNSLQGSKYGTFISSCGLIESDEFYVIPIPGSLTAAELLPTFHICGS
jgi:hypothetical protein